jgi:hypothetical protein
MRKFLFGLQGQDQVATEAAWLNGKNIGKDHEKAKNS